MKKNISAAFVRICRRCLIWAAATSASLVVSYAQRAGGATLTDATYFNSRAHTLVTFEQRGNGSPAPTENATLLPFNEYSNWGFTFAPGLSPGVAWINDISLDSDAGQVVGGSLPLGIAAMDNLGDFFIHFGSRPIVAFGFWVQHTRERTGIPKLDAVNGTTILESASFAGAAIDGRFGNIDYGFLGISRATPFSSIHVRGDVALLDNFRFIAVPEPSGLAGAFVAAMSLLCSAFQRRANRVCVARI